MQHDLDEETLGAYQLYEKLGEGAAGAVYRAEHEMLQREYAVKVVHRRLAQNETFRQRFFREARLAARLVHPNIVRVVTADRQQDYFYLVMEYVEGLSLEKVVDRQGPLSMERAVQIVDQVLAGLEYAHDQGMLHRDVKAENVLLDDEDVPRLTDFGLVVDINEGSDLTAQDAVLGTPYYMAPEQWEGDELDVRADVFSTGVLLYYLLSGRFPFPGDAPLEVMYRLTKAPAEPMNLGHIDGLEPDAGAEMTAKLQSIVDRALTREREERFPSATRFREALQGWLDEIRRHSKSGLDEQTRPSEISDGKSVEEQDDAGQSQSTRHAYVQSGDHEMNTPRQPDVDLETDYVEIADGTYWVGKRPDDEIFYANPYLRTFGGEEPDGESFNLLIDPGSSKDFSVVQSKVSQVVGSVNNVTSVFINHQDPDVGSSVGLMLGRYTPNAHVLCTEDTWRLVHYYNIPRERFVPLEKYPNGIRLPTDDVVMPVPSPFCHFVGAMMLYDPETRVLFSGDLFGGLTDRDADGLYADESDWTGMRAFHQIYMPTQSAVQNAIENIKALDPPVEVIAPQHGRVIAGDYVQEYMERLYHLPVGLDVLDDRQASDEELHAWTTVLARIVEIAESAVGEQKVQNLLARDPNLSGHITFDGGEPTVENLGKTSVERAVRLLCDVVPHETANSIKYEAVFATDELGLPTPQVELDEDGDSEKGDEQEVDGSVDFDVA